MNDATKAKFIEKLNSEYFHESVKPMMLKLFNAKTDKTREKYARSLFTDMRLNLIPIECHTNTRLNIALIIGIEKTTELTKEYSRIEA